ncbi:hypothetical protein PIB30_066414 [Stylosanthes scabra]|uniref:Uncharacterized protein n=1 Tax=Stylosanthes scabra TaxID=79078 RepID=A0ABU6RMA9_9FABA|nr:hypothetical protein [Stylosanthes scabra]
MMVVLQQLGCWLCGLFLAQSATLQKCLDLRGIVLPDSGLKVCQEQWPKLVKLACRVCEFPQQGLSLEYPKPSKEWLRDSFGRLCRSEALEVGNSSFVFQSKPYWRGNPEVGNSGSSRS